MKNIWH